MTGRTLYDKLWDSHLVKQNSDGSSLIYIDRHVIHEVTSPQAFEGLRIAGDCLGAWILILPPLITISLLTRLSVMPVLRV